MQDEVLNTDSEKNTAVTLSQKLSASLIEEHFKYERLEKHLSDT